MADTTQSTLEVSGHKPQASSQPPQPRGKTHAQKMREIYALPAPLRTFPLPTFIPHNPLSLFHFLYVWVSQAIKTPSSHIDPLYQGWFSLETRSVHVTDARAIRGLWEQGFFGKGTLSRSEPSWMTREKSRLVKKGKGANTSEEHTGERRAARQKMKWERARKEREAIDQRLSEEAASLMDERDVLDDAHATPPQPVPEQPVVETPEQLASQPDLNSPSISHVDLGPRHRHSDSSIIKCFVEDFDSTFVERFYAPPVGPMELLALPNSINEYGPAIPSFTAQSTNPRTDSKLHMNGNANVLNIPNAKLNNTTSLLGELGIDRHNTFEQVELVGGSDTNEDTVDESVHSEETIETSPTPPNGSPSTPKMKRQKSVRFSPTVEKNTFIQTEPPSPERGAESTTITKEEPLIIRDQEHLQLTLEESFFLSYALGALEVLDPETKSPISNKDLFTLCRQTSYFTPKVDPVLAPDDPFMINYVVYHHFRSLGWVLRSGIKFSVDYLLYNRGPVFTHAEFAVLILPSYSDPYWKSDPFLENYSKGQESRSWAWMSCINRVITQAKKSLILCYVDIPKPLDASTEHELGIDAVLGRYKIREFVMARFVANRMRSSAGKERGK